jgi:hypothetical protein
LIGIGMDGDEEIGAVLAPQFDALVKAQVVIPVAHQLGAHPRLPIDQVRQLTGNGEGDLLFKGAIDPDGPGVLATMPRVNGDNEIAPPMASGLGGRRPRGPRRRKRAGLGRHVHHQPMPIALVGFQDEALGTHPLLEIDDDPQLAIFEHATAHPLDQPVLGLRQGSLPATRPSGISMMSRSGAETGNILCSKARSASMTNWVWSGAIQSRAP